MPTSRAGGGVPRSLPRPSRGGEASGPCRPTVAAPLRCRSASGQARPLPVPHPQRGCSRGLETAGERSATGAGTTGHVDERDARSEPAEGDRATRCGPLRRTAASPTRRSRLPSRIRDPQVSEQPTRHAPRLAARSTVRPRTPRRRGHKAVRGDEWTERQRASSFLRSGSPMMWTFIMAPGTLSRSGFFEAAVDGQGLRGAPMFSRSEATTSSPRRPKGQTMRSTR